MPSVIEIEETQTEVQPQPVYESPQPARVYTSRRGLTSKLVAALKTRRAERPIEDVAGYEVPEMPLDTLARKHPYMYADALLS